MIKRLRAFVARRPPVAPPPPMPVAPPPENPLAHIDIRELGRMWQRQEITSDQYCDESRRRLREKREGLFKEEER